MADARDKLMEASIKAALFDGPKMPGYGITPDQLDAVNRWGLWCDRHDRAVSPNGRCLKCDLETYQDQIDAQLPKAAEGYE